MTSATPPPGLLVGIDVGGTTIDAVAATYVDGPVLARGTRPTPTDGGPAFLAAVVDAITEVGDLAGGDLRAVGIAVPGLVDCDRGTVAHAVNLGIGAAPLALADRLSAAVGAPVVIDNDARAAAMAALALLRRDRLGVDDVAYLNVGTGLALGLVLGGRPHRGPLGHAGEIGHVPLPGSDIMCACGLRGCMEARIAGPAIARLWPDPGGRSTRALFTAAADGDGAARDLADQVVADVALVVHLVVNMTGVGDVVLGGGVAMAHDGLLTGVRESLVRTRRRSPLAAVALDPQRITTAPPGTAFGAVGALAVAAQAVTAPAATAAAPDPADPDQLFPTTARVTDAAPPGTDASQAGARVHQGERR